MICLQCAQEVTNADRYCNRCADTCPPPRTVIATRDDRPQSAHHRAPLPSTPTIEQSADAATGTARTKVDFTTKIPPDGR